MIPIFLIKTKQSLRNKILKFILFSIEMLWNLIHQFQCLDALLDLQVEELDYLFLKTLVACHGITGGRDAMEDKDLHESER